MKYKVVAYLKQPILNRDKPIIRYRLKKIGWFSIWWTVNESGNKEELQKQADELNLIINH